MDMVGYPTRKGLVGMRAAGGMRWPWSSRKPFPQGFLGPLGMPSYFVYTFFCSPQQNGPAHVLRPHAIPPSQEAFPWPTWLVPELFMGLKPSDWVGETTPQGLGAGAKSFNANSKVSRDKNPAPNAGIPGTSLTATSCQEFENLCLWVLFFCFGLFVVVVGLV